MGRTKEGGSKRKMNKDPNKPKRSLSAYFFYVQNQRKESERRGEKITRVAEFTKAVSVKWRALTDEQKVPFAEQAAVDKDRYQKAMAIYKGTDENKPKRPQSSYFLFLAKFRAANKDRIKENRALLQQAGAAWKQLSDAEKKPFEASAAVEKEKYEVAMREYNMGGGAAKKQKTIPESNGANAYADDEDDDEEEEDDDEEEDDE